jgi:ATP-dependent Clp protease adaptor protein ClpS
MGKMSTDTATRSKVKVNVRNDLTPPPKFKVIFMNDNVTTVDFVIAVLQEIFDHNFDSAQELTVKIHEEGSASVAILPFEIAESKAVETTLLARTNQFPLAVKIEPEV